MDSELNLSRSPNEADQWIKVRLLFVRGIAAQEKMQPSKHDWVVFVTTNTHFEPQHILKHYAMEVNFKETAKQYLDFLKAQSNHYATMRFCMLVIAKSLHEANGIADMRQQITANATSIDYASRLWQVFRTVIAGALDEMTMLIEDIASEVMGAIKRQVQSLLVQALQLDVRTLRLEAK